MKAALDGNLSTKQRNAITSQIDINKDLLAFTKESNLLSENVS